MGVKSAIAAEGVLPDLRPVVGLALMGAKVGCGTVGTAVGEGRVGCLDGAEVGKREGFGALSTVG